MKNLLLAGVCAGSILAFGGYAKADSISLHNGGLRADSHAPIGVMGDHMHGKGEWMVSYRFGRMHMDGNRDGTNSLSPEDIVTAVPNRFGVPATLRVVPTEMTTNMHMFGAMYAPTDYLTLMAMGNFIERDMKHITFQGGAGTTRLGEFSTKVRGWGDTKLSGLIKLYNDDMHDIHLNAGISLPTGSITKSDDILTPTGGTPTVRLPYAMQLGTGTYDLLPGITYNGHMGHYGWGAQYTARFHLGENNNDYTRGDKHALTAWGSYLITPAVSVSARVTGETESKIDGIDNRIVAPVQTADPDNYGGERINTSLGLNFVAPTGVMKGHRFSIEGTAPVYQDLNGPQLENDNTIMVGWSKAF